MLSKCPASMHGVCTLTQPSQRQRLICTGIQPGAKVLLLGQPGEDELAKLNVPDQRIRGFDEELIHASGRRQSHASTSSPPSGELSRPLYGQLSIMPCRCQEAHWHRSVHSDRSFFDAGNYTFHTFEAWTHPSLHPPPPEALKLLHRLAADRGIAAVMAQHRQVDSFWRLQDCIAL